MNIIAHIPVMKSHTLSFTVQMMPLLVVSITGVVVVKITILNYF
jgi:hypothetical protein